MEINTTANSSYSKTHQIDMVLKNKISNNTDNKTILKFLCKDHKDDLDYSLVYFTEIETKYKTDTLLYFYKLPVPDDTKYFFNNYGIFINPTSGQIFAIQFGQYDIAFRLNYNKSPILLSKKDLGQFANSDNSVITDISSWGDNWVLAINFVGDLERQINWSYEISGDNYQDPHNKIFAF